jgi:hypothetical protein
MTLEVAGDSVHAQARQRGSEVLGARVDHRLGDVNGHISVERPRVIHRLEEQQRLRGGAGPQLHQLRGSGRGDDLGAAPHEDLALAPRRVVLGQLADAVEQVGPRAS